MPTTPEKGAIVIKNMKILFSIFLLNLIMILTACSNNDQSGIEQIITKDYIDEQAKVGLSAEEVKEVFGEPKLSGLVDNTETWLYYAPDDPTNYEPSLEAVNHQAILDEAVDYEFYINFIDEKAFIYSLFYKSGEEVQEYQVLPDLED